MTPWKLVTAAHASRITVTALIFGLRLVKSSALAMAANALSSASASLVMIDRRLLQIGPAIGSVINAE